MPTPTLTEYVEINNVILALPSWEAPNLAPLWARGPLRGGDRLIPDADGQMPLSRRTDEWHVDPMPLYVYGFADQDGNPASDGRAQLRENMDFLLANIWTPNQTTQEGTWPLVLHGPGGTTYTADCFVNSPQTTAFAPAIALCVLDLIIPAGSLSPGGS
jgi:hypothetical protein